MLVDDGFVFDDPPQPRYYASAPVLDQQQHQPPSGSSRGLALDSASSILVEQRAVADDLIRRGGRTDSGKSALDAVDRLLSAADDGANLEYGVPGGPPHELGYYSSRGPELSWAVRERLRTSLDRSAPAHVLEAVRALARTPGQTGISAWRTYRDMEKQPNPRIRNLPYNRPLSRTGSEVSFPEYRRGSTTRQKRVALDSYESLPPWTPSR